MNAALLTPAFSICSVRSENYEESSVSPPMTCFMEVMNNIGNI